MKRLLLSFSVFFSFVMPVMADGKIVKLQLRDFMHLDTIQLVVTYAPYQARGLAMEYWKGNDLGEFASRTIIDKYNTLRNNKKRNEPILSATSQSRYVINVKIVRIDVNDCETYGYLEVVDKDTDTQIFDCYFDVEGYDEEGVKPRLAKVMSYFGRKLYYEINRHGMYFKKNYITVDASTIDERIAKTHKQNAKLRYLLD